MSRHLVAVAGRVGFAIVRPASGHANLKEFHMADHGDYQRGSMDISEHTQSWAGFTAFVKWSIIGILIIMVFLAIFRTHG